MQRVISIWNKEVRDYFISPIAYIVISVFLLVTGWLFFSTFFIYNQADLRNFFNLLPVAFAFVVPAITMRLFSEEINRGSYETLLTLPVTFRDIILGKYLAGLAMVAAILVPFASALTRNQIVAFILGALICFTLTVFDRMLFFFPAFMVDVVSYLGAGHHFQNISKGIIDSRDIVYFLSIAFIGLYATHLVMQEKK